TIAGDGLVRLADGSELRVHTNGTSGPVSWVARPEKSSRADGGFNRLTGRVKESAYIGVATELVVATTVGELTVFHQNVEAGGAAPGSGSDVPLSWPREATSVVDPGDRADRADRGEEQAI